MLKDIYYETSINSNIYKFHLIFYDSKNMKNKIYTFKMDDTNTPIFTHAKMEYTKQLIDILTPQIF